MEREALKLALEALENIAENATTAYYDDWCGAEAEQALTAIKAVLAQPAQEPVSHLWESLGRWSAYLVQNGKQADCAPPAWLVDAIKNATTPPQPAQEPVAWITPDGEGFRIRFSPPTSEVPLGWDALYTAPQQRPWVGLTDEEIHALPNYSEDRIIYQLIRAAEAKLRSKNT